MLNQSKNILYVTSVGSHWGSEKSLLLLLKCIDKKKFNPFVFTVHGQFETVLREQKIPFSTYVDQTLSRKDCLNFLILVFRLFRLIKKRRFALVHSNDIHSSQYSILAAWLARVPSVLHIRNTELNGWFGWKNRFIFKFASKAIAVSKKVRDSLHEIGMRSNKIQIIHNAVDLSDFGSQISGKSFRDEFNINENDKLIGIVGRIVFYKGQDYFIQAIPKILSSFPNSKFMIVGEDSDPQLNFLNQLRELIKSLNLEEYVYFSGYRSDIPQIMKALSVLIVPSLGEAFGRVIIESMAAGTPVVAFSIGGIPDIIINYYNGILLLNKTPNAISNAVIKLLSNRPLYQKLSANGRKTVENQFSLSNQSIIINKLYYSLINGSMNQKKANQ